MYGLFELDKKCKIVKKLFVIKDIYSRLPPWLDGRMLTYLLPYLLT